MFKKIIGLGLLVCLVFFVVIFSVPAKISPKSSVEIKKPSFAVQQYLSDINQFKNIPSKALCTLWSALNTTPRTRHHRTPRQQLHVAHTNELTHMRVCRRHNGSRWWNAKEIDRVVGEAVVARHNRSTYIIVPHTRSIPTHYIIAPYERTHNSARRHWNSVEYGDKKRGRCNIPTSTTHLCYIPVHTRGTQTNY